VIVEGLTIGPLPVLARGGVSMIELHEEYRRTHAEGLGKDTFNVILLAMTSKSKAVTGLSSYYIEMLHLSETVSAMLVSAGEVEATEATERRLDTDVSTKRLSGRAAHHLEQMKQNVTYLKYAYGHNHLQVGACDGVVMSGHAWP